MKRFSFLVWLVVFLAHAAHGAGVKIRTAGGATIQRELPARDEERVIIEFREHPLLVRSGPRIRADAAKLESLQAQLATDLARMKGSLRIEHRYELAFAGASVRVDRDALPAIRALSYVKAVHPDRKVRATLETTVPLIGAPQVWERFQTRGRGITVAVLDSGIDYTHPALGGAFGAAAKVAGGYDFVNEDEDPMDDYGHGTHVAGIVAGAEAPVVGVAPEATLLAYKVLDSGGYGVDSWILGAIERLLDPNGDGDPADRADVVNMSFGRLPVADDPVVRAVEQATAAGVVFCISTGNDGNTFAVGSPGVAPSAISVGATDHEDFLASFSSRGPVLRTWAMKPEVTAPGVDVASAAIGGGTLVASGTSMAAPHVAGLAALVRELHPEWTPEEVKSAIVTTARPLDSVVSAGAGRIDAVHAMETTLLASPSTLAFGIVDVKTGVWQAARTFRLTNRGEEPQSLTIAGQAPAGVTMTVSRPALVLLPGATRDVTVDLAVDAAVAVPRDEGFALSGNIVIASDSASVHLPWMVLAGNIVVAAYQGTGDNYVALFQNGQLLNEGNGAAGAVASPGTVDALVVGLPPRGGTQRVVVREEQPVDGPTLLDVSPDEAKYDLVIDSVAADGRKLSSLGHRWLLQTLRLPSGVEVLHMPEGPLVVSPLAKTRIETSEQAVHSTWIGGAFQAGVHAAVLRPLIGLPKNEDLSVGASEWTTGVVEHPCATGIACDYEAGIFAANEVWTHPFGASRTSRLATVSLAGGTEDGRAPKVMFRVREGDRPQVPYTKGASLFSPWFRAHEGKLVAQLGPEPGPLDYAAPAGDATMPYGYGPTILRTTMGIRWRQGEFGRPGDEWTVDATPAGMRGEELADDALRLRVTAFDAEGRRYDGVRIVADSFRLSEPMRDGPHRVEIVQEYRIGEARGVGTLTARVDKATSASAPTLTALRIEDGEGRASFELDPGEPARLVFSGRQSTYFERSNPVHTSLDPSATKVYWRRHPSTEWLPFPVSVLGSDDGGAEPLGSMFSVDLSPVTASVRAGVALKIELASELGSASWTLEPAFFVSGAKRRRSMR